MRKFWPALACAALALASPSLMAAPPPSPPATPQSETFRAWVEEMKDRPRGPFSGVRWFCADGAVLEPAPFACASHGGGFQHGQWSDRTRQLRAAGYPIANVLADLDPADVVGPGADPDLLTLLLLEKFLVAADDGWILREAQFYRGAFQDYDERDGAATILLAMLALPERPSGPAPPFAVMREAVRLLPHGAESAAITKLRGMAATIADQDAQFQTLRSKIHSMPDAADAQRVRDYAAGPQGAALLQADFAALAAMIDQVNDRQTTAAAFRSLSRRIRTPALAQRFRKLASELESAGDAESQFRLGSEALVLVREHLPELGPPEVQLAALDASVGAEIAVFTASRTVLQSLAHATRAERLAWMGVAARAVYGLGLLNARELAEIEQSVAALTPARVRLEVYRGELQELGRAAAWPEHRLGYHFGNAIDRLTPIEPLAATYVADRLRGSAMLFYSNVLESLAQDADRLSEMRHSLFGEESAGLRRVNPGLARGVLRTSADLALTETLAPIAIYLVPETTSDLPAVAGILTAAEGNALSHVQLLARNLGIPNVVVGRPLLLVLERYRGRSIVVTASSGGVVRIEEDGPGWDALLGNTRLGEPIYVNLAKLDLARTHLVPTTQLRASDSGRIAGPKAAQVGELTHHFPAHVSLGLAIPFGTYRAVLDRPLGRGKVSMFEWLKAEYSELAVRKELDPEYYGRRMPEVLAFVRQWLQSADLGPGFRESLRDDMHDLFGMEGTYGVFVRSDTNVEDLAGFTGAGLNQTVPNVVSVDDVIVAIKQVWASPSTERAFGWRQGLMDLPEHVYASVLLHRSVPNDKSGVLVTANLDTGDRDQITVVTNTGVAGGVDGQAAETLVISLKTGAARLLASATARTKRVLAAEGGARQVSSEAPEYVLSPDEIRQLLDFVRAFPKDYPGLQDAAGRTAPADIEFGFVGGHLMLLQIRPFVQSPQVSQNKYLMDLDAGLRRTGDKSVDLRAVPGTPS
jgi:hypothetical protein